MKKEIIKSIKMFSSEALNPRNDGWVQKHYVDRIKEIQDECSRALQKLEARFSECSFETKGFLDEEED